MKTLAQKGGSGKTTLAVHMAVCATQRKLRTALIDLDPQSSAYDWNESREGSRKLDAVKASSGQLAALLHQAKAAKADLAIDLQKMNWVWLFWNDDDILCIQ